MSAPYFIYIADVYCPWCYGFGPIMKRIAAENPQFPVQVIGGSLMSRPTDLMSYAASDPELYEFWQEVQQTTGRDLSGALAALRNGEAIRMYSPGADLILAALKKLAPRHELEQLLMLESMFYAQGMDIFTDAAIEQIAREWNLDAGKLADLANSGQNEQQMLADLDDAKRLMGEITSYPSVLLTRNGKVDAVSRGYVHYETVVQRLRDAMNDLGVNAEPGEYCSWHENCAFGKRRPK